MTATIDRVRYECAECGLRTWASTRTGECYSHNVPGLVPVKVCSMSRVVVVPSDELRDVEALVIERPKSTRPEPTSDPRYYDESETSVRTVSGGLPGLGRHR